MIDLTQSKKEAEKQLIQLGLETQAVLKKISTLKIQKQTIQKGIDETFAKRAQELADFETNLKEKETLLLEREEEAQQVLSTQGAWATALNQKEDELFQKTLQLTQREESITAREANIEMVLQETKGVIERMRANHE